jgi:hypothetical protein
MFVGDLLPLPEDLPFDPGVRQQYPKEIPPPVVRPDKAQREKKATPPPVTEQKKKKG